MGDLDSDIRLAAFEHLRRLMLMHGGALPWSAIAQGFTARGDRYLFASAAEGIFKPAAMTDVLSIKTVVPKPEGRIWYHDQSSPKFSSEHDVLWYAFTGRDKGNARNRWLLRAMERQLPLIYFFGVAPAVYEPIFPAFIVKWNAEKLSCGLSFSISESEARPSIPSPPERRYATRSVEQRLHQSMFRQRVLSACRYRCALTQLPGAWLVDAAHIVPDRHEDLGQPDIRNGICMSKLHHAAYDAGLIGIDSDLRIHISKLLLDTRDGPMLEQGFKALAGRFIHVPTDPSASPDRDRLAFRFERFLASS